MSAARIVLTLTRHRGLRLPALVCASLFLSGCGSSNVTFDQLKARPEGHLYYPGSVVIGVAGNDESPGGIDGGSSPATFEAALKSPAAVSDILTWYQEKLRALGWEYRGVPGDSTSHVFSRGSRDLYSILFGHTFDDRTYTVAYTVCHAPNPPDLSRALLHC